MYTGLVLFLVGTVWLLSRIKPIGNICNTDWNEYKKCDSQAERNLFRELAKWSIPIQCQKPIGKRQRLDFFLPSHGVVVELDSYFHDNPEQQARDRRKDKLVKEAGWKMVRVRCEWAIEDQLMEIAKTLPRR